MRATTSLPPTDPDAGPPAPPVLGGVGEQRLATRLSHHEAVARVIGTMRGRLEEAFTLEDMAEVACMSRFHFNRAFRRTTGVPPCLFLSAVRLQTAKRLLLTTRLSITDICFEVGYSSLGTFIRRFTEMVGVPPGRLRSLARQTRFWPTDLRVQPVRRQGLTVSGEVRADVVLCGPVFVGLFATPMPQGRPVACAVLSGPGRFTMSVPPRDLGRLYLFATAHAWSRDPISYLLCDPALRGGGQPLCFEGGRVGGSTDIRLRPASPTDPPILLALPFIRAQGNSPAETV